MSFDPCSQHSTGPLMSLLQIDESQESRHLQHLVSLHTVHRQDDSLGIGEMLVEFIQLRLELVVPCRRAEFRHQLMNEQMSHDRQKRGRSIRIDLDGVIIELLRHLQVLGLLLITTLDAELPSHCHPSKGKRRQSFIVLWFQLNELNQLGLTGKPHMASLINIAKEVTLPEPHSSHSEQEGRAVVGRRAWLELSSRSIRRSLQS